MKNVENIMKTVLSKRIDAMAKQASHREEFQNKNEIVLRDIEETRSLWINTMKQLPQR